MKLRDAYRIDDDDDGSLHDESLDDESACILNATCSIDGSDEEASDAEGHTGGAGGKSTETHPRRAAPPIPHHYC